jgi:hypothetical protein
VSAPAGFFKPVTKRELAGVRRSLGLFVNRLVRQNAKPNPTLAKAPKAREEKRYYTKADLMRRWLKRGERRTREGEAARLILDMPVPVATVLETVQETHERLYDLEQRQRAVFAALDFEVSA